jgi:hypothetical protein
MKTNTRSGLKAAAAALTLACLAAPAGAGLYATPARVDVYVEG